MEEGKLSFSRRVALSFMAATAALTLLVFVLIYFVVYHTVYNDLKSDLRAESVELTNNIVVLSDQVIFANPNEWQEREHGQIEVNPIFIQYADSTGKVLKRSPNLQEGYLSVFKNISSDYFFDSRLANATVYQLQVPLKNTQGKPLGYISVAMPLSEAHMVLKNLRLILIVLFPFVLLFLYFVTLFMSERSIRPVLDLTRAAQKMTQDNYENPIVLPTRKDELFSLTFSVNQLVEKLRGAAVRERQFAIEASHELRTPLSVLRGTIEVMLRKQRPSEYYVSKANTALTEVDKMTDLTEQLLFLYQFENNQKKIQQDNVNLLQVVGEVLNSLENVLNEKSLNLDVQVPNEISVHTNKFMFVSLLRTYIIQMSRHSSVEQQINISASLSENLLQIDIRDNGIKMDTEELNALNGNPNISEPNPKEEFKSNGLGLTIAGRFARLLNISVKAAHEDLGNCISLLINNLKE
ncbi:MAG: HAMP domain-containing histidine kinase [Bacteroidales bacterium]|nr:HAMP domain-containing histidine kinase [Bacteroidales bacterium]